MKALRPLAQNALRKRPAVIPVPRAQYAPQSTKRSIQCSARQATRQRGAPTSQFRHQRSYQALRQRWQPLFKDFRSIRHNSSNPNPTPHLGSPKPPEGRLKKLFREYGWAGIGVYLLLSAADLPICFGIVRWVGPDRVGEIEHAVLEYIRKTWHTINPLSDKTQVDTVPPIEDKATATVREGIIGGDIAHAEAAAKDGSKASLWTELVLAYAIHKSLFVFIRVPLTIAVTPKVVKTLRGWGWEIGKRRPKVPKA